MNLQYISDSNGRTTGVFIPIEEWNKLKAKYKGIEQEEIDIPKWHLDIIEERYESYKKDPKQALDFDSEINEIENNL